MADVVPYSAEIITQAAIPVSHTPVGVGETSHNRIAEVSTNTYVLQTASNAALSGKSGVPSWLANAIADSIVDGEIDIRQIITDLDTALRSLVTGVTQQISSVQTTVESNNTLMTGVVSRLDDDIAGVITLANSKVTPEEASATMATFLEAEFNTPTVIANSTILNLLNTTSNATGTLATDITNLNSSFSQSNTDLQINVDANASITDSRLTFAGIGSDGGLLATGSIIEEISAAVGPLEVRLTTEESVSVGTHVWDGVETLRIGMKDSLVAPSSTYMGAIIGWVLDTNIDSSTANSAISLLNTTTIPALQAQVDGVIDSWFGPYTPSQTNLPWSGWIAIDNAVIETPDETVEQDKHTGDLFYDLDTGTAYRFAKVLDVFGWNVVTDTAITLALHNASLAQDTADGKRAIYYKATPPAGTDAAPLGTGDMWIPSADYGEDYTAGEVYIYVAGATPLVWVTATKYTDDSSVVTLQTGLENGTVSIDLSLATVDGTKSIIDLVSEEIDKEVVVYSGTNHTAQTGMKLNDIYIEKTVDTSGAVPVDVVNTWKYSGTVWNQIGTNENLTALADLADGKRTIYSNQSHDVPSGEVNDIWIPTTGTNDAVYIPGEIYQYITGWVPATRYSADILTLSLNIQEQLDGKVETYYQATVPTGLTELNTNDYWYCTENVSIYLKGKVYKYTHATLSWTETADVSKYVFDIADAKSTIFTTTTLPSVYNIRDLLIVAGSNFSNGTTTFAPGVVLTSTISRTTGFVAADWIKQVNDTEDLDAFALVVNGEVDALQAQIDGKIDYYFLLSTDPLPSAGWTIAQKNEHHGDALYFTDTEVAKRYTAVSDTWVDADDLTSIMELLSTAQGTADGKMNMFAGYISTSTDVPTTGIIAQDHWLQTDTGILKVYDGGWVTVTLTPNDINDSIMRTKSTPLSDIAVSGRVTYVYTDSNVWVAASTEDGVQAKEWAGGAQSVITNPTTGAVTGWNYAANPNISEFRISADSFYIQNSAVEGYSPFSIVNSNVQFNGFVTFSNVTGTDDLIQDIVDAQTAATSAQASANAAISVNTTQGAELTAITSESIVDKSEKLSLRVTRDQIVKEYTELINQAASAVETTVDNTVISTSTYTTSYNALITYLNSSSVLIDSNVDTILDSRTTFTDKFKDYYTAEEALRNAITTRLKSNVTALRTMWGSVENGYTTIDGGKITTGTLLANSVGTEVMYDSTHWINGVDQGPTVYNMKIDLSNGLIHIK